MTNHEQEWAEAADDPDLEDDLGYRPLALDVVAAEQYEQLLLLPSDEDQLRKDAFIVAGEDDMVDLGDNV